MRNRSIKKLLFGASTIAGAGVVAWALAGVVIGKTATANAGAATNSAITRTKHQTTAPTSINRIQAAGDAQALLQGWEETGLTPSEISLTAPLYAFKTGTRAFPDGETVFRTPLGKDGFCLTFGNGANCSHVQPDAKTPVIGFGTDLDSEGAGVPFVLFGIKAANVTNVIYRCAGSNYPATIVGSSVSFVAPTSELTMSQCNQVATLADGTTVVTPQ